MKNFVPNKLDANNFFRGNWKKFNGLVSLAEWFFAEAFSRGGVAVPDNRFTSTPQTSLKKNSHSSDARIKLYFLELRYVIDLEKGRIEFRIVSLGEKWNFNCQKDVSPMCWRLKIIFVPYLRVATIFTLIHRYSLKNGCNDSQLKNLNYCIHSNRVIIVMNDFPYLSCENSVIETKWIYIKVWCLIYYILAWIPNYYNYLLPKNLCARD